MLILTQHERTSKWVFAFVYNMNNAKHDENRDSKGHFIKGHLLGKRFKKGQTSLNKGKTGIYTLETLKKMRLAKLGKPSPSNGKTRPEITGDKHFNWKGGHDSKTRRKHAPRPKPEQCEICGAFDIDFKKGLCLDHDHITGEFRGWLCTRCNCALGMVNDNTETLLALVSYINKFR